MIAIKLIKKLLAEELNSGKDSAFQAVKNEPDFVKTIVSDAFEHKLNKLQTLVLRQEVDDFLSECGYRMSLEDWEMYYEKDPK